MEGIRIHQCVRLSKFENHRTLTASLSSCLIASTPLFVWVEVATVIFHTHIFNYANLDAWYWWSKEYQIYQWKDARFSKSCFIILIKTIVDQSQKIGRGLVCTTFNTEQSKMHVWGDSTSQLFLSSARNRVVWNTLHAPLRFLVKRITKKHKKEQKQKTIRKTHPELETINRHRT